MLPQEIIRKKRNRQPLSADEISEFIKGITDGSIMDAQTAALTMAVFLNGLNANETVALTMAMRDSGDVLEWKGFDAPIVDKHSSGGVGDKVSLMLAPLLAACGVYVPMISGRGLGHTGGTLDKFDSIPGYKTMPNNDLFRRTVKEAGCAVIGQTGNLAPADKKIYAIRDVCGTVESIELITASILSKKLAAGLEYLVMDLKCGNGAFMDNIEDARKLARSIVKVANGAGTKTSALITDMNQVLGRTVGNALEMKEAVDFLKGENVDSRLAEITLALCAELLVNARQAATEQEARTKLQTAWQNGQALEHFAPHGHAARRSCRFLRPPAELSGSGCRYSPRFCRRTGICLRHADPRHRPCLDKTERRTHPQRSETGLRYRLQRILPTRRLSGRSTPDCTDSRSIRRRLSASCRRLESGGKTGIGTAVAYQPDNRKNQCIIKSRHNRRLFINF